MLYVCPYDKKAVLVMQPLTAKLIAIDTVLFKYPTAGE